MHSEEGCTALMQASRFGHAHVVEVLLHARAEPDWRTIPSAGALRSSLPVKEALRAHVKDSWPPTCDCCVIAM